MKEPTNTLELAKEIATFIITYPCYDQSGIVQAKIDKYIDRMKDISKMETTEDKVIRRHKDYILLKEANHRLLIEVSKYKKLYEDLKKSRQEEKDKEPIKKIELADMIIFDIPNTYKIIDNIQKIANFINNQ